MQLVGQAVLTHAQHRAAKCRSAFFLLFTSSQDVSQEWLTFFSTASTSVAMPKMHVGHTTVECLLVLWTNSSMSVFATVSWGFVILQV